NVAPPVMVAKVETHADLPSAPQKAPESPAATQIRSDIAVIREAHAADVVDKLPKPASRTPAQQAKVDADVSKPNPIARKAERMAMLDAKLLDDSTLGDLTAKAARERKKEAR
ncbi:MAG: colicin transporter, partial [Sphingobium sp.]|nr:colicin transporter [Sphingobium sp.]